MYEVACACTLASVAIIETAAIASGFRGFFIISPVSLSFQLVPMIAALGNAVAAPRLLKTRPMMSDACHDCWQKITRQDQQHVDLSFSHCFLAGMGPARTGAGPGSLLSRFAPCPGLVALRQTFAPPSQAPLGRGSKPVP